MMPLAALQPETGFSPRQIGYDAILQKHEVPVRFRADFLSFMQSGQASGEFIAYVNATPSCQEAVEEVLAQHMKNLKPLLHAFSAPLPSSATVPVGGAPKSALRAEASGVCAE